MARLAAAVGSLCAALAMASILRLVTGAGWVSGFGSASNGGMDMNFGCWLDDFSD